MLTISYSKQLCSRLATTEQHNISSCAGAVELYTVLQTAVAKYKTSRFLAPTEQNILEPAELKYITIGATWSA